MITIDGSMGEGGGQILRTSLALSLVTGQAFRIQNIHAGRAKPGLLRQHFTAVEAAVKISDAAVDGAVPASKELLFKPGKVQSGDYRFAIGTAGSATLVLQTILPALIIGTEKSRLILEGGTHNPYAPPFDFLAQTFLPLVNRMGPQTTGASNALERCGQLPNPLSRAIADCASARRNRFFKNLIDRHAPGRRQMLVEGRDRFRFAGLEGGEQPFRLAPEMIQVWACRKLLFHNVLRRFARTRNRPHEKRAVIVM
jgi:RNA 3'-phosphate cyclase